MENFLNKKICQEMNLNNLGYFFYFYDFNYDRVNDNIFVFEG
jgi:hypothetical protein